MENSFGEKPKHNNDKLNLKYTRRDFLIKAGLGMLAAKIISDRKPKENREYKGIKVPIFVSEKPLNDKEKFIPGEIIELIDKASLILESQEAGFKIIQIPIEDQKTKDKLESNVLLASVDLINHPDEIEILKLNPKKQLEEDQEGHQIQVGEKLGVGTSYEVIIPEQHVVLATKQAITINDKPTEVVYSPYSPDLDIPKVRFEGFKYLVDLLQSAKQELTKKGVKSRIKGAKEIAPGIPLEVALMLTIVEQVDPGIFERKSTQIMKKYGISQERSDVQAVKAMAKKGITVVGQNRKNARRYARSPVGASGLFQLMPNTYRSLAGVDLDKDKNIIKTKEIIYPKADLKPDFLEGATDHTNAAQAAWLLLDSDLSNAGESLRNTRLKDPNQLGMYLAACYNAGSKPVRDSIEKQGDAWPQNLPSKETKIYIRKFSAIYALFKETEEDLPELTKTAKNRTLDDRNRSSKRDLDDLPDELVGGASSLAKQAEVAKKQGLEYIETKDRLRELVEGGKLAPLPENNLIKVASNLKQENRNYCLPETVKFLVDMAEASHLFNPDFEPLMVNSSVRPRELQGDMLDPKSPKYNPNASTKSSHPTGATFDIAYNANGAGYKGMSQAQLEWTERYLVQYEKRGLIEAVEERNQTVFHIMVFKDYIKSL